MRRPSATAGCCASIAVHAHRITWESCALRLRHSRFDESAREIVRERGTTSELKFVPVVVLCNFVSGDANQGGEMEVLTREPDEFEAPVLVLELARQGV